LLVAVQLLRNGFRARLRVIEPRTKLGRGLAYSTEFDAHLLNVPAGKMSALPDDPTHFLEWLRARDWPGAAPGFFAPRKLYGEYLEDLLQGAIGAQRGNFEHVRTEVVAIQAQKDGVFVELAGGVHVAAENVVLALGNPAAGPPSAHWTSGTRDRQHLSPWLGNALGRPCPGERILLIGTGLTAVDSVLALHGQEPDCRTWMVSRKGILPHVHDPRLAPAPPLPVQERRNLLRMFRDLRTRVAAFQEMDLCWRGVVDALRPFSNQIWHDLPPADQQRFLRHLKTYWETHRHRMAPEIAERLDHYRKEGRLHVIAGRLRATLASGAAVEARISLRDGSERRLEVDRIINCTGIHENYTERPRQLIQSLIENRLATPNDLGIGFRTDRHGGLIDAGMRPSPVLFTLGPPRRGELFETTAVPEIRVQAEALARHLAGYN